MSPTKQQRIILMGSILLTRKCDAPTHYVYEIPFGATTKHQWSNAHGQNRYITSHGAIKQEVAIFYFSFWGPHLPSYPQAG